MQAAAGGYRTLFPLAPPAETSVAAVAQQSPAAVAPDEPVAKK